MKAKNPLVGMNRLRAGFALQALKAYCKVTGITINNDGLGTAISDFLGDLMHLSKKHKVSFDDRVEHAEHHYQYETAFFCRRCHRMHDAESDNTMKGDICIECEKKGKKKNGKKKKTV